MRRRTAIGVALAALAALAGVVALLAGARRLARARTYQLFGTLVSRVETRERVVALTFDDGPTDALADSVARMLEARGVRATFFVTGAELARAPAAGRRLAAAGHELGNHTYSHARMVLRSPGTVRREVEATDSVIRAAGYRGEIRFRPPYGYKLVGLPRYLGRTGRTTVMWDVEPDSHADVAATPAWIVSHVLARVRPGSIVLLHVWYPSRATSLAAVPLLLDSLRARGWRVTTVGGLLGRAPPSLAAP
jgi:peptidoglycan/xylan/chitin deacetylase (PgdA/CDA1 family)